MPAEITVLVLNYNRKDLLFRCLEACTKLDHDGVRPRLVCVDNGSTDGTVDELRVRFPEVGVMALPENIGFARAYNEVIPKVDTEWVALLNNDTIPQPQWLSAAYDVACRNRAAAIGSRMLKDGGTKVDFVGTTMNFYGHGFHQHFNEPASYKGEEEPIIAACGGAMICRRDVFVEAGGFDEAFFAYFEDLDLGWRLNVLGHDIFHAPESLVLHEHAATNSGLVPGYQRLAWLERNGLYSVVKNYGDPRLARVLPVALALCVKRAELDSTINPDSFFFEKSGLHRNGSGKRAAPAPRVRRSPLKRASTLLKVRGPINGPLYAAYRLLGKRFEGGRGPAGDLPEGFDQMYRVGFSRIAAIEALIRDSSRLQARRAKVQRARRRSDEAVVELFRDTFRPSFPNPELRVAQDELVEAFGLAELF
jgi:GT2 family glycosyltransferase